MKRVYIAGPMRGKPLYNFAAFFRAAILWRQEGFIVANPAERDMAMGFDPSKPLDQQAPGWSLDEVMAWDLDQVKNADAVALLVGWEQSVGARKEVIAGLNAGVEFRAQTDQNLGDEYCQPQHWELLKAGDAAQRMLEAVDA